MSPFLGWGTVLLFTTASRPPSTSWISLFSWSTPLHFLFRLSVRFYFFQMSFSLRIISTVYPKRAWRSFRDPVGSIFVPLIVSCSMENFLYADIFPNPLIYIGFIFCHYHNRYRQLCCASRLHQPRFHLCSVLVRRNVQRLLPAIVDSRVDCGNPGYTLHSP